MKVMKKKSFPKKLNLFKDSFNVLGFQWENSIQRGESADREENFMFLWRKRLWNYNYSNIIDIFSI